MGLLLGFKQSLPISDGNLVVIGMDFREGEEPVTVAAVLDKRRLQRGFDPRHLGEIDIAAQRLLACRFEIEFFDPVTAQHHHPGFFRV